MARSCSAPGTSSASRERSSTSPSTAGWLLPLLLLGAVGLVRHADGRLRTALLAFAAAWSAGYLAFTIRLLAATR